MIQAFGLIFQALGVISGATENVENILATIKKTTEEYSLFSLSFARRLCHPHHLRFSAVHPTLMVPFPAQLFFPAGGFGAEKSAGAPPGFEPQFVRSTIEEGPLVNLLHRNSHTVVLVFSLNPPSLLALPAWWCWPWPWRVRLSPELISRASGTSAVVGRLRQ